MGLRLLGMAKDSTSPANPHSSCVQLSFSVRRSLFPASTDRSRSLSSLEAERAMSRGVRLLQPAPHPSGQRRARAKLPGGSGPGRAAGSRGVWANIAQGHLRLGLWPLVQDFTRPNSSSLWLGSWRICRTRYLGEKKGSSEQAFSVQVVPLSLAGLFSHRNTLLCLGHFNTREIAFRAAFPLNPRCLRGPMLQAGPARSKARGSSGGFWQAKKKEETSGAPRP